MIAQFSFRMALSRRACSSRRRAAMSVRRATKRASSMIMSGGVNIYPHGCENPLATHPKVADAAIFAFPTRMWARK